MEQCTFHIKIFLGHHYFK